MSNWTANLLKALYAWFKKRTTSKSDKPLQIEPSEISERYIIDRNWFNIKGVKPAAFLPRTDPNFGLSTSIFRESRMSSYEKRQTKAEFEKLANNRKIKKVAQLIISDIESQSNLDESKNSIPLKVVPEESQFKWHADIINWPADKHEQKAICLELSKKAKMISP
ncbi:MAG: hypothetical protein M1473_03335 [Firmicutes bacterium]|nr:hypothetical protein [Bacillota bacterium]